jgi:hypothetical protein
MTREFSDPNNLSSALFAAIYLHVALVDTEDYYIHTRYDLHKLYLWAQRQLLLQLAVSVGKVSNLDTYALQNSYINRKIGMIYLTKLNLCSPRASPSKRYTKWFWVKTVHTTSATANPMESRTAVCFRLKFSALHHLPIS